VRSALNYAERLRKGYVAYSNDNKNAKDELITRLQQKDSKGFLRLRDSYANESLEEFVTNKSETKKTIEYKGEITQKLDQIFMDPKYNFIKAHFYAPVKRIFGRSVDTYIMNVGVLWLMTIILYLILYFRLLKKLLESSGETIEKKLKNSE